jgi:hypothetical protein
MKNVPAVKVVTTLDAAESPLPPQIQEALGELVGAAREGLLALSVGVGLRVVHELMEAEHRMPDAERSHAREHAAHQRRGRPDSSRPLAGNRCHGARTPAHEATTAVLTSMARRDERRPTCQTKMP